MSTAARPPKNSTTAMSFKAKFNRDYAYYAKPNATPYEQLIAAYNDPYMSVTATAALFGCVPSAFYRWAEHIKADRAKQLENQAYQGL